MQCAGARVCAVDLVAAFFMCLLRLFLLFLFNLMECVCAHRVCGSIAGIMEICARTFAGVARMEDDKVAVKKP